MREEVPTRASLRRLDQLATEQVYQQLDQLPKWEASKFSPLEVPIQLAEALGNPQNLVPSVHVAGTNGKGSVCAYLAACFDAEGFSVGQFVSPHLSDVTERCLIAGEPVGQAEFAAAVQQVLDTAEHLSLTPSFFVVTMLATFLVFAERGLERAVIEVGLGGRFDATNILAQPLLSVITRIGFDHTHWLGEDLETIAGNKAGIIKTGTSVVLARNEAVVLSVCQEAADAVGSRLYAAGRDFQSDGSLLLIEGEELPLYLSTIEAGSFHAENRAAAMCAARLLGISRSAMEQAAARVRWPGRTELFEVSHVNDAGEALRTAVLLDGLHNPQGASAFAEYLKKLLASKSYSSLQFLISIRASKRADEMLQHLVAASKAHSGEVHFTFTGADIPLAESLEVLRSYLPEAEIIPQSRDALSSALQRAREGSLLLVVGSLYLIGALRPQLTSAPFRSIVHE